MSYMQSNTRELTPQSLYKTEELLVRPSSSRKRDAPSGLAMGKKAPTGADLVSFLTPTSLLPVFDSPLVEPRLQVLSLRGYKVVVLQLS